MTWRILLMAILPVLIGCTSQPPSAPPVWSYYDNCAAENPSFVEMVKCGREKRLAECQPKNECSAEGNLFMEFADRLALSVKNKQKSEAEARRQLNPNCNRSIGLISYRRGWSGKRRYCSRKCRDALVTEPPNESHQDWNGTSRLAWLFLPAPVKPSFKVTPAVVRSRTR